MAESRPARAALLRFALVVAATGLAGCLGSGPDKQAQATLSSALDELAKRPALHYRGALPGSKPATTIDAHVMRGGIALGTVQLGSSRVRVLAIEGKRFVRGNAAFWSRNGVFQPSLARTYARRWVQIGPRSVRGFPPLRTPAQLAAWLRRTADPDAAQASQARVRGAPATRIDIGDGAVFVTATKPHRVVRVQAAERLGAEPKTAAIRAGPSMASTVTGSGPPDAEGVDVSQPEAEEFDELIDDVEDATRELDEAVDAQIQFTNAPAFSCSRGGTCTASNTVTKVVSAEGEATGRVDVTLDAAITARGLTQRCTDSRSMAPDSSASLSCSASFPVPQTRTPTVVPVVGNLHMTARADVNVKRLVQAVERERTGGAGAAGSTVTASDGTQIVGLTRHGINRVIGDGARRAGVTPRALLDTIKNPTRITEGVDDRGRPFRIYDGADARVVINPETGRVVSVNPRTGAGANR